MKRHPKEWRLTRRQADTAAIDKARLLILSDAKGRPAKGQIDCPKCGNQLAYSVMTSGRIYGCCKLTDCLWWVDS